MQDYRLLNAAYGPVRPYVSQAIAGTRAELFSRTEGRRLARFKNIHAGRRCFIIGNGPSVRQMDLTKLKNEYTFATNYFMLHERFDDLGIKYYCMSDPQMWNHGRGFSEALYQKLNSRKDMVKFFGHGAKKTCKKLGLFKENEPYYVFVNCARLVRDGFFLRDITRYTNWGNTVIVDFCLPLAQYMGFTQIYLLGCDCDYGQGVSGGSSYFYPVSDSQRPDAADDMMITRWPEWVFRSYRVVRDALEPDGIKIYNAGYGGKLEVFERVDYDSIV